MNCPTPAANLAVEALIFDMDGTMVNSMPYHAQSWLDFRRRHGLDGDLPDLMRRTTGRNGVECMRELFQRDMPSDEAWALIHDFEDAPFGIEAARRAGMRAVAICTTHTPTELAGPHVMASVRDYTDLMNSNFLENLHVASS